MLRLKTSALTTGLLGVAIWLAFASPSEAGFLDTLFGRPSQPVRASLPENDPLHVTVRKRRAPAKAAIPKEVPVVLQRSTLDPSKDPYWYLKDETLRRGDIVVLPNRVLIVRDKAATFRSSGFEDIRRSASLSSRERSRILAMTEFRSGVTPVKYRIIPEPRSAPDTISQLDRSSVPVILP